MTTTHKLPAMIETIGAMIAQDGLTTATIHEVRDELDNLECSTGAGRHVRDVMRSILTIAILDRNAEAKR